MSAASHVKSAERVMDVMRFLAGSARPVPSMSIAEHCGLPKSSTYHLLNCMRNRNFVTYYPDQRAWGLGPSTVEVGTAFLRADRVSWLARPLVGQLADSTSATAHLAVLHGTDALYVLKEPLKHGGLHSISAVGVRLPAHLTAVGRAMLMRLPREQLHALYPLGARLVKRTTRGPDLVVQLERELETARREGYAMDDGMTTPGVTCIGATVFSHEGLPVAGLGVSVSRSRAGRPSHDQLAGEVTRSAAQLSRAMGWTPSERVVDSSARQVACAG